MKETLTSLIEAGAVVACLGQEGFFADPPDLFNPKHPGSAPSQTRQQVFEYRNDGALRTHVYDGRETRYEHSPAGWMTSATDWREASDPSRFSYFEAGTIDAIRLGGSVATASFGYHPDGSARQLVWSGPAGLELRSHRALSYDVGGLLTGETVSIAPAAGSTGVDTGGPASYSYDLGGRLTGWTSPFRLDPDRPSTDAPATVYELSPCEGGPARPFVARSRTRNGPRVEGGRVAG